MPFKIKVQTELTGIVCVTCGMEFAVPEWWESKRRDDHVWFYCPNGHNQHFPQKTEAEELREKLDASNRLLSVRNTQLDDVRKVRDTLERSNRALRSHTQSVKKRAAAGVCPAGCKRHFTNLQRHIATKHPTWKTEKAE